MALSILVFGAVVCATPSGFVSPLKGGTDDSRSITVRLKPSADADQRKEVFETLARIAEPTRVTLPAGAEIEALLKQRCGFSTPELVEVFRKENPGFSGGKSAAPRELDLPPCPYWAFDRVAVLNESGPKGAKAVMESQMGFSGPRTRQQIVQNNPQLGGTLRNAIRGQTIRLPFVTHAISFRLKATVDMAQALEAVNSSLLSIVPAEGGVTIDLEREIEPASAGAECVDGPPTSGWPYDRVQVLLALRSGATTTTVSVLIADTGLSRDYIDKLPIADNKGEKGNKEFDGKDNDLDGYVDNRYGCNMDPEGRFPALDPAFSRAWHGTEVGSIVAGGVSDDELAKEIRKHLRLVFGNIVRAHKTAGNPPFWEITNAAVQNSLRFAASQRAPIVNWSIQSTQELGSLVNAMRANETLLVVVAAGNDGRVLDDVHVVYPASYVSELSGQMITVAALNRDGGLAEFSNYGPKFVDLAAAGCDIEVLSSEGVKRVSGTSFAAPMVSLTAALISAKGVTQTAEIKMRILSTVTHDPRLSSQVRSGGRLSIEKAIAVDRDIIQETNGRIRYGDVLHAKSSLELCGEKVQLEDVLRIIPHRGTDSRPTWVLLRKYNELGRPVGTDEKYCELPHLAIEFREQEQATQTLQLEDLGEYIPRLREQ